MAPISGTPAVTPQEADRCDHCGGKFNPSFALGKRVYGIKVWLCSPACYWRLLKAWR